MLREETVWTRVFPVLRIAAVIVGLAAVIALSIIAFRIDRASVRISRAVEKMTAAVPDLEAVGHTIHKAHAIYYRAPFSFNGTRESAEDTDGDGVQDRWAVELRPGTPNRLTYVLQAPGVEPGTASVVFGPIDTNQMAYTRIDKGPSEPPCQVVSLMSRTNPGRTFLYTDFNQDGRFDRLTEQIDADETVVGSWVMFEAGWVSLIDPFHFTRENLRVTTREGEVLSVSFNSGSGLWEYSPDKKP